jgi:hypothetical protein
MSLSHYQHSQLRRIEVRVRRRRPVLAVAANRAQRLRRRDPRPDAGPSGRPWPAVRPAEPGRPAPGPGQRIRIASSLLNAGQQDVSQALTATQIAKMHRRAEIAQLARDVKRTRRWGPRRALVQSAPRRSASPAAEAGRAGCRAASPRDQSQACGFYRSACVHRHRFAARTRWDVRAAGPHRFDTDGRRAHDRQMEHPRR